ncbi:nitroreductase [Acinetobacter pseudolwoffii]|uniref:Nitrobenzoate reductase n=1 Tax=Acinetobacter pseudolwoffii TaxID=2053287 RepID=A0A2H9YNV4_9GAMM|nr:nitroreductase [Acinetobacter pseudolwoffii]MBU3845947.1 nitroreductase [Candidatus Acinetobacter avistercoris]MDH5819443.1 nitroreductase [Acinetobacter pseudolwoffii]MDM1325097.1 nitroreductase [Acinetobacter pseudolwoffii]PJO74334.1 nitrobenzoate reductase [Acinetobacter pseudolwoffii]
MQQHTLVDQAITSRHSVRAFKNTPLDTQTIKDILNIACRAPSGNNIQPWKVYVVTGQKREALIQKVCAAQKEIFSNPENADLYQETFKYYPIKWTSPFIERRRENGWSLYGLLGIQKGEQNKMQQQLLRNYQLFDAPVGLFFTANTILETGSKMDIAMMIQNVMIAAKARGIDSCPQAAWNPFHQVVADVLGIPEDEELVCAIALGYADPDQVVNQLHTPRVPAEEFAVFCD